MDLTKEMLSVYLQSKEHEDFLTSSGTIERVYDCAEELRKKFEKDEDTKDDIDCSLLAAYNIGEDSGIMQGFRLAMRFVFEYIQVKV